MKKNVQKVLKRVSLIAIVIFLFTFVAYASTQNAKNADEITRHISRAIQEKKTSVEIDYSFSITAAQMNRAVQNAVTATLENMASVSGYSYTIRGARVSVSLSYSKFVSSTVSYADTDSDIIAAIARAVNLKDSELLIYYPDKQKLYDMSSMLKKSDTLYNQYLLESWDEYNVYNLNSATYAVNTTAVPDAGFFIRYTFSYKESLKEREAVQKFAKDIIASLNIGHLSVEEKVRTINNWVVTYTDYLLTGAMSNYTAYGLMSNKTAVCQGYALMTHLLLEEAGIQSSLVPGTVFQSSDSKNYDHIWNVVNVNGRWLHLDTTWNEGPLGGPAVTEEYFLLTAKEIAAKHHKWDEEAFNDATFAAKVYKRNRSKDMTVVLKIDSPHMTVGGNLTEVDPGRGTAPVIIKDRTFIPLRTVIEEFSGSVFWMPRERQVIVNYKDFVIDTWIDSDRAMINGYAFRMDANPTIINDRTMVPIRFVAEKLGFGIVWNAADSTVTIIPYKI